MRILIKLSALCCAMFFCGAAAAEMTAKEFRDSCREVFNTSIATIADMANRNTSMAKCTYYISGYREGWRGAMYDVATNTTAGDSKNFDYEKYERQTASICVPASTANLLIEDTFREYIDRHPEYLDKPVSIVLWLALKARYPCKSETKGGAK